MGIASARGELLVKFDPRDETDPEVPAPGDGIDTQGRLRPQLAAGAAVLPLRPVEKGIWVVGIKKAKSFQ
ncbi:hypothetical protein Ms3S1_p11890 (plasmid) [Methylosinus sp. 3S-1]|uniref:Uncharacterized protein n=1 Tax=Methylosinus trichosporium (strain ATCC 35070 / NCIMB 11131 / UNIQEM 75 / OB3b) TaxID=595536 RepID=A0A2D2D770_METT3|nr:hypothetical protein CQW49_22245 [Methylosinus trichosporium OB3b]OBS52813.1 hypothetical protein A8B73_08960 [Methylosinus sp. 3S-1]